ncbi:hypothetical protein MCAMS1_01539 [biofilm metagenome]
MKQIMTVCLCMVLAYSSTTEAKCKRAEVAGIWAVYFGLGVAARCTLKIPKSGLTAAVGSYCYVPGFASTIPLNGSLLLSPNCHVSGHLSINGTQSPIDGWISKDKETISGMS